MTRLGKRHVEAMLDGYDTDPIASLVAALRIVLDAPGASWDVLLDRAPITGPRRAALLRNEVVALDELFVELNEMRTLGP